MRSGSPTRTCDAEEAGASVVVVHHQAQGVLVDGKQSAGAAGTAHELVLTWRVAQQDFVEWQVVRL